jgi:U4/U6.U5 tri-snRNP-associated protein 3
MDEDNDRSPKAGEEEPEEELDEDEAAMQAMMGFGGFGTTKGKKVAGNNAGAIKKEKKTEYRQYMNRVGGFNRPLSPSR